MNEGRLRFSPLSCYRASELKDDVERYDASEGATKIDQPSSVKRLMIGFRDKKTGVALGRFEHRLVSPIRWFDPKGFSHVLCFTIHQAILQGENTIELTLAGRSLGSSVLIVHDIAAFVAHVGEFMQAKNVAFECRPVDYVAPDYEGEYSAFMKPARLQHQREYRLAVRLDGAEIEEFRVPRIGETMEVFEGLKINFTAGEQ